MATWRTTITGAALVALGAFLAPILGGAAPAGGATEPPTLTLSTHEIQVGTELVVRGTGCIDPSTGSGDGVLVIAGRGIDPGDSGQAGPALFDFTPVEPDGSFAVTATIEAPVATGPSQIDVACFLRNDLRQTGMVHEFDPVVVTGTSPPLEGFRIDGRRISVTDPCLGITSSMGVDATFAVRAPDGDPVVVEVVAPVAGRAEIVLPTDLAPGTYGLDGRCFRRRESRPVTILHRTFTWPLPPDADADTPEEPSPPARPMPGRATYTG